MYAMLVAAIRAWNPGRQAVSTALAFVASVVVAGCVAARAGDARLWAMLVLVLACVCALLLGATIWLRGRAAYADALQPFLIVLLPVLLSPGWLGLLLVACASLGLAQWSVGRGALERQVFAKGAPGRWLLRQETLGCLVLVLLVWSRHVELPTLPQGEGLDTSWTAAMAHFLAAGKRAGTDWIFTAGPLAGLQSSVYQPDTYWWKLVLWEGFWRCATAICFVLAALRIRGLFERGLLFLVLIIPQHSIDAYALGTIVAAALLLDDREERSGPCVRSLAVLALCGLAWIKFTLFVATLALFAALTLARGLRYGLGSGLRFAALCFGTLALFWFLSGQGLANFWPYLQSSWQIASTYSEAQSLPPLDPSWRVLGLCCVVLLGVSLALWVLVGGNSRSRAAAALGLAAVVFCGWKTGFVRAHDHAQFYFGFVALSALYFPRACATGILGGCITGVRISTCVLACVGMGNSDPSGQGLDSLAVDMRLAPQSVQQAVGALFDPQGMRKSFAQQLFQQRLACAMPLVSARVGNESIDMLGFRPGLLLLLRMNWTPRPAFQNYITFTPWLQQRNAEFLAGPQAPRFLLGKLEAIDDRWPMMDDAQALEVVSRRYDPVLTEREYLLLERRAEPRSAAPRELVLERELAFGELLPLPVAPEDCTQFVTLEIEHTLLGRLARLLEATPRIDMRLTRDDGLVEEHRIVPATMRSRVQIDPLVVAPEDWVSWMIGKSLPRCIALSVDAPADQRWRLEPRFRVRIERVRGLQPPPAHDFRFQDWRERVFTPRPDAEVALIPPSSARVGLSDVEVVHAPARFIWRLAAGHYHLRGAYGVLEAAWARPEHDGSDFVVALSTNTGVRTLMKREFRRGEPPSESTLQALDLEFELEQPGRLLLVTTVGPAGNSACDWCYWSNVKITREESPAPPK
jgi:hypothetical protein